MKCGLWLLIMTARVTDQQVPDNRSALTSSGERERGKGRRIFFSQLLNEVQI